MIQNDQWWSMDFNLLRFCHHLHHSTQTGWELLSNGVLPVSHCTLRLVHMLHLKAKAALWQRAPSRWDRMSRSGSWKDEKKLPQYKVQPLWSWSVEEESKEPSPVLVCWSISCTCPAHIQSYPSVPYLEILESWCPAQGVMTSPASLLQKEPWSQVRNFDLSTASTCMASGQCSKLGRDISPLLGETQKIRYPHSQFPAYPLFQVLTCCFSEWDALLQLPAGPRIQLSYDIQWDLRRGAFKHPIVTALATLQWLSLQLLPGSETTRTFAGRPDWPRGEIWQNAFGALGKPLGNPSEKRTKVPKHSSSMIHAVQNASIALCTLPPRPGGAPSQALAFPLRGFSCKGHENESSDVQTVWKLQKQRCNITVICAADGGDIK